MAGLVEPMADRVGMKRSFDVDESLRCRALRCQRGMTLDLTSVGFRIFEVGEVGVLVACAFMADMLVVFFVWCSVVVFFCRVNDLLSGDLRRVGGR